MEVETQFPASHVRLRTLIAAPLDKWIALSEDQSRIVAVAETYGELAAELDAAGDMDVVVMKTPPSWGEFSL